jgi:hypothetical protein
MEISMLEAKEVQAGLVIMQDGKRVTAPKSGNCSVRPVAGGQFVKVNGQEVIKDLGQLFPGCIFLWLSKPVQGKASTDDTKPGNKDPDKDKK